MKKMIRSLAAAVMTAVESAEPQDPCRSRNERRREAAKRPISKAPLVVRTGIATGAGVTCLIFGLALSSFLPPSPFAEVLPVLGFALGFFIALFMV